jgi:hypothetical protein
MTFPEFPDVDAIRRLWWLHDSFWHAAVFRELGPDRANRLNLEANEKMARMATNLLLRERLIERPKNIQGLMLVFKVFWKNVFFDGLYVDEPIEYSGNTATWVGSRCHGYDALSRARMIEGYACGCQAIRDGVMKALRLQPVHEICESLVQGHGRCVIRLSFVPKG